MQGAVDELRRARYVELALIFSDKSVSTRISRRQATNDTSTLAPTHQAVVIIACLYFQRASLALLTLVLILINGKARMNKGDRIKKKNRELYSEENICMSKKKNSEIRKKNIVLPS